MSNKSIKDISKGIKFFFTDVDGTLTDGVTYYSENGEFLKGFSHVDGTGFHLLKNSNIEPGIITGEDSQIVIRRAEKLKLKNCFININDKLTRISEFAFEENIKLSEIAFIGDDLNDLCLIKKVGISFATGNAHDLIKSNATFILNKHGGNGAFREAVEILLNLRDIEVWDAFNVKE